MNLNLAPNKSHSNLTSPTNNYIKSPVILRQAQQVQTAWYEKMTKVEEAKEAIEEAAAKEANREIESGGEAGSVSSEKIVIGHIIADAEAATARDETTVQEEVVQLVNNDKMDAKSVIKKVKQESKAEKVEIKTTIKSQKNELKNGGTGLSLEKDYEDDVRAAIKEEKVALKAIPTEVKVAKKMVKSLMKDGTMAESTTPTTATQPVEEGKASAVKSSVADKAAKQEAKVLLPPSTPVVQQASTIPKIPPSQQQEKEQQ